MTNKFLLLISVIILFALAAEILYQRNIQQTCDRLVSLLSQKKYQEFDTLINNRKAVRKIPVYNLNTLRFNAAILRNQPSSADAAFCSMLSLNHLTDKQKASFYLHAFSWYLSQKNKDKCSACRNQISQLHGFESEKESVEQICSVMLDDDTSQLEHLLQTVSVQHGKERAISETMAAHIYHVLGKYKEEKEMSLAAASDWSSEDL